MTAPIPPIEILPRSPLSVGQAISSTIDIVKRRFGLFLGLAALPVVAATIIWLVAAAALGAALYQAFIMSAYTSRATGLAGAVVIGLIVTVVASIGVVLLMVKVGGMTSLLVLETGNGRHPSFSDLHQRTRGITLRALPVLLTFSAAVALIVPLVVVAMLAPLVTSMSGSGSNAGSAVAGQLGLLVLLYFAFLIGEVYFSIRWLYFQPILAIEGRGGFDSLKRSWTLTAKDFWRTLGWYLLGNLLIGAAFWIVQLVGTALLTPLITGLANGSRTGASAAAVASVAYLVVVMVVALLAIPLQLTYQTIMYVDQVRRNAMIEAGVPLRWVPEQYPSRAGFAPAPTMNPAQGYPQQPQQGFPAQPGYPTQQSQQGFPTQPGYPTQQPQQGYLAQPLPPTFPSPQSFTTQPGYPTQQPYPAPPAPPAYPATTSYPSLTGQPQQPTPWTPSSGPAASQPPAVAPEELTIPRPWRPQSDGSTPPN